MKTNNLNTFKILFIVKGALSILGIAFGGLYVGMGTLVGNSIPPNAFQNASADPFGGDPTRIFVIVGGIIMIASVILATINFLAAKFIKERRNYTFVFVAACINVLTGILGILLAVFTLIELSKPHVKGLFEGHEGEGEHGEMLDQV